MARRPARARAPPSSSVHSGGWRPPPVTGRARAARRARGRRADEDVVARAEPPRRVHARAPGALDAQRAHRARVDAHPRREREGAAARASTRAHASAGSAGGAAMRAAPPAHRAPCAL